jgi:hypothetical protein
LWWVSTESPVIAPPVPLLAPLLAAPPVPLLAPLLLVVPPVPLERPVEPDELPVLEALVLDELPVLAPPPVPVLRLEPQAPCVKSARVAASPAPSQPMSARRMVHLVMEARTVARLRCGMLDILAVAQGALFCCASASRAE